MYVGYVKKFGIGRKRLKKLRKDQIKSRPNQINRRKRNDILAVRRGMIEVDVGGHRRSTWCIRSA